MSKKNSRELFQLISFFKPYKRELCFALVALSITALMILFFGKAIKYLIDYGFVEKSFAFLNLFLLICAGAIIMMALAGYFRSSIINAVCEKVMVDLRKKVYEHIIKVSPEFFEITKTGDVISRLTSDSLVLYNIISSSFAFFLRNLLLFFGGIAFLFFTSLKLTLISLALITIAVSPIFIMGKLIKKLSKKAQDAFSDVGAHIEETVNGIKTVQAYLCEEKEIKNFHKFSEDALKVSLEKIKLRSLLVALVIALSFGGISVVLYVGGHDVLNEKMSSGDLSAFIFYAVISATSLVSLSQIAGQMQTASASAARIFELLAIESRVKEIKHPQHLQKSSQINIEFKNIEFSYPTRKNFAILRDFNLSITPYEKIAIVGASGSGKSTIFQLLLRFYDIDEGLISLNGIDIRNLSLKDLRQNFSYISQDCFIFSGSIFENISYVDKNINRVQVEKIIEENEALHFIKHTAQGLDTYVGEKGVKLSGGERQRIAMARAIVKDSPVLLLDEATSALDNKNERVMIDAINELAHGKTVITIAHRLSTVVNADRIIFLRDGQIVESGTHDELMRGGGYYRKMYLNLADVNNEG